MESDGLGDQPLVFSRNLQPDFHVHDPRRGRCHKIDLKINFFVILPKKQQILTSHNGRTPGTVSQGRVTNLWLSKGLRGSDLPGLCDGYDVAKLSSKVATIWDVRLKTIKKWSTLNVGCQSSMGQY